MRVTPSGTSFSDLHAVVHAWQPMHRDWSITFTQRGGALPVLEQVTHVERLLDLQLRVHTATPSPRHSCARAHMRSQSCSSRGSSTR